MVNESKGTLVVGCIGLLIGVLYLFYPLICLWRTERLLVQYATSGASVTGYVLRQRSELYIVSVLVFPLVALWRLHYVTYAYCRPDTDEIVIKQAIWVPFEFSVPPSRLIEIVVLPGYPISGYPKISANTRLFESGFCCAPTATTSDDGGPADNHFQPTRDWILRPLLLGILFLSGCHPLISGETPDNSSRMVLGLFLLLGIAINLCRFRIRRRKMLYDEMVGRIDEQEYSQVTAALDGGGDLTPFRIRELVDGDVTTSGAQEQEMPNLTNSTVVESSLGESALGKEKDKANPPVTEQQEDGYSGQLRTMV